MPPQVMGFHHVFCHLSFVSVWAADTPIEPQSAFKFYTTLPLVTQPCEAKLLWFAPAHNQDSILQRLLLHCKSQRKLSITPLLFFDKGEHVNSGMEFVWGLNLPGGTWHRHWGAVPSDRQREAAVPTPPPECLAPLLPQPTSTDEK